MIARHPFVVVPRFTGVPLVVVEPSPALLHPDPATAQDLLATTLTSGLAVAVLAHEDVRAAEGERILVLDNGRLIEHGSPAELTGLPNGVYARLRQSWDGGTRLAER